MTFSWSREALQARSSLPRPVERLSHRGDIDGLRAVAVVPVVFYHAGIAGFGGGFVGVDVFFVISGYLMAALVVGELDRGEFSLLRFYERRVRRIFPALFAVIIASAIAAWFLFLPVEFTYFAQSMKAAALFVANLRFMREEGYFDIASQLKPLIHTWSLAVEEQFYIVFPVAMLLVCRFFRKHLALILLATLAASLAASVWAVHHKPEAAFYLAQYRAWELLLGAMLAINLIPRPASHVAREAMAAAGMLLIGVSVFDFGEGMTFPGMAALVPCLGAALVIHARATDGPVGSILRAPPLVFLGLISYSLYLWHWPIIVYTRYLAETQPSSVQSWTIVAASVGLAWCSWRFIEQPFRGPSSRIERKPLFAAATGVLAASAAFGAFVASESGLPSRLSSQVREIYSATYDVSRFSRDGCFANSEGRKPSASDVRSGNVCKLGAEASNVDFVVWGDSHGAAMSPAIDIAAAQENATGLLAAHPGCPPLLDVRLSDPRKQEICDQFNAAAFDLVAKRHIPLVFLIAYWPKYVHDSELPNQGIHFDASVPPPLGDHSAPISAGLERTLSELRRIGTKAVLVMDVPEMGRYVPDALAKAVMRGTSTEIAPPLAYIEKRQALPRAMLERFAAKYDAKIVDPLPAFCDEERCRAAHDGIPLYRDSDHITAAAARDLSYLYAPVFQSMGSSLAKVETRSTDERQP